MNRAWFLGAKWSPHTQEKVTTASKNDPPRASISIRHGLLGGLK